MARPLRVEHPGGYYHVTARGVARQDLFWEDGDREELLKILRDGHERWGVVFHGYCLMSNHYHLEVETPGANLSRTVQWINQKYAAYVNRTYRRVGHLFQGRFKSVLVEGEEQLQELTRYVHMNPVRAGMVAHPADYRWSSYGAYLGLVKAPPWLATERTLRGFGRGAKEQHQNYREFVETGVARDPLREMKFGAVLGSRRFVDWFQRQVQSKRDDPEVSHLAKAKARVNLEQVLRAVVQTYGVSEESVRSRDRKRNEARDVAIYLSRLHTGCLSREIGEYFGGIRPAAVSLASKRVEQRLQKRQFRETIAQLTTRLKEH